MSAKEHGIQIFANLLYFFKDFAEDRVAAFGDRIQCGLSGN